MNVQSRRPDALLIPESMKQGRRSYLRICSILAIAEPFLGVSHERGERVYFRRTLRTAESTTNPRERTCLLFATTNEHDTMLYPTGHPKHPQPRYRWEQDGPVHFGYLIDPPEEQIGIYDRIPIPPG